MLSLTLKIMYAKKKKKNNYCCKVETQKGKSMDNQSGDKWVKIKVMPLDFDLKRMQGK